MPLDHARDVVSEDCEEEDMPPPADNDGRGPIYTFSPGMTPLSFSSTSAPIASNQDTSPQPSSSLLSSPSISPITLEESNPTFSMSTALARPHGKRRDPSYIPRPPNAFILFRCAFIKEQNVPGKVEGNHSRLSKIIGLCWKQLPTEEREKWEAKAVIAQAEHRAHYPDWRFRPGANAMAKLKVKEAVPTTTRRRSVRSRAKDRSSVEDGDENDAAPSDTKGKGKMKSTHMVSLEETRCAKIAGFVAEGIKGEELEVAVKQWEGDHKIPRSAAKSTKSKGRRLQEREGSSHSRSHSDATPIPLSFFMPSSVPYSSDASTLHHTQNTLTHPSDAVKLNPSGTNTRDNQNAADSPSHLPDVPLTHMFKRSLSAPAPNSRLPYLQSPSSDPSDSSTDEFSPSSAEPSPGVVGSFKPPVLQEVPTRTHNHGRRETISFPMSTISETSSFDSPQQLTWQEADNRRSYEEVQGPDSWWTQKSALAESQRFGYDAQAEQTGRVDLSPQGMGYEIPQGGSQFDRGYLEQYGPFDANTNREPGQPEWRDMSGSGRQGLSIVLEDPYKDDCCTATPPSNASPPTLSLPPLSSGGYYYSQISPHTPSNFASSSFSTLRDWAGEYKHQPPSDLRTWPDQPTSTTQSPSSSPWYNNPDNPVPWGTHPPQLQHATLAHDSEDWDHLEYRTSSNAHLPVEPPRQVNFQDELRRLQSNMS